MVVNGAAVNDTFVAALVGGMVAVALLPLLCKLFYYLHLIAA